MNSKLFARIGAVSFVAIAITMAALELREEPAPPATEIVTVPVENDKAEATLAYCSELGLEAASVDICTEAWAAERRRFLGQTERDAAQHNADAAPTNGSDPVATQTAEGR
jgi:conjugative transfer region protein TrbK